jgi:endogenous inhibitor of DNA gyrase (YacG/DUF329 family)
MKCPHCGRKMEYSRDNPFRPFCSKQCKMADLGAWLSEEYTVSSPLVPDEVLVEPAEEKTEYLQ